MPYLRPLSSPRLYALVRSQPRRCVPLGAGGPREAPEDGATFWTIGVDAVPPSESDRTMFVVLQLGGREVE